MSAASCTFTMVLFDDEAVRKKLMFMNQMECMFDDERNTVPEEYWWLLEDLKPGEKIEITVKRF